MEIELLVSTPNIRHIYYLLTQICKLCLAMYRMESTLLEERAYQKIIKTSTARHKTSADSFLVKVCLSDGSLHYFGVELFMVEIYFNL